MKKLFGMLAVLCCLVFVGSPVLANGGGGDRLTVKDNNVLVGNRNVGIQGNKNHHNIIAGGDINSGNATIGDVTATGGNATAYGGDACAVGVGVGFGGDGGNATIEEGAVEVNNTNTNNNTNIQGQMQDQDQAQSQSMGDQSNTQDVAVTVEGDSYTYNEAENKRAFANGVSANFAPIPIYVGPDAQGPTYQDLISVIRLKSIWQRFEVEPSISKTDIMYRCRYFLKRPGVTKNITDEIAVLTERPQGQFNLVAHVTLWAETIYTTSFELMMKACLLAMDLPTSDAILITGQGCEKFVKSTGWGIGFNHTTATMSGSQNTSNVSSGGTGYSSGKAGNKGKPWIQVMVLDYK